MSGDIHLYHTLDGGEIEVAGGEVRTTGGLESLVYLSLFGGNANDSAAENDPLQWWGNFIELDAARKYRSRTQNVLRSLPVSTGNLRKLQQAISLDLQDLQTRGIITGADVSLYLEDRNRVCITLVIHGDSESLELIYQLNWEADIEARQNV